MEQLERFIAARLVEYALERQLLITRVDYGRPRVEKDQYLTRITFGDPRTGYWVRAFIGSYGEHMRILLRFHTRQAVNEDSYSDPHEAVQRIDYFFTYKKYPPY